MTAKKKLHSDQIDIITAFSNSRLEEKIYIQQPFYFDNRNKNQVLLLLQRFYRSKKATRFWFDNFLEKWKN